MSALNLVFSLTLMLNLAFVSTLHASEWDQARLQLETPQTITVYRDVNCQCCHKWIEHLEKHQFVVIDTISNNMSQIKEKLGVPNNMASCHTAVINEYVIEGHVPADDIKQLLIDQPGHIKGLSVPQMPVGTPGMEMGPRKDHFIVFSFDQDDEYQLFNAYQTNDENNYLPLNPTQ
ncbi:DUF411 domain-containing protein [Methylophaga sp.]|uniref:DUF411 domain-containing protein n=1 Tax=Methylophaga sp. TaxID=2024840 RepID=UPI003A94A477